MTSLQIRICSKTERPCSSQSFRVILRITCRDNGDRFATQNDELLLWHNSHDQIRMYCTRRVLLYKNRNSAGFSRRGQSSNFSSAACGSPASFFQSSLIKRISVIKYNTDFRLHLGVNCAWKKLRRKKELKNVRKLGDALLLQFSAS